MGYRTIRFDKSHEALISEIAKGLDVDFETANYAILEFSLMALAVMIEPEEDQVRMLNDLADDDKVEKMIEVMKTLKSLSK